MWSAIELGADVAPHAAALGETPSGGHDPQVLCVADEAYALPLAVTLSSAARHLRPGRRLRVSIVDTGLSEASWVGLKETLADCPVSVQRLAFDPQPLRHLPISHHISHAAYVRLLAATLLPPELERVIYLDSDLLVCDDLGDLWETPLDDAWCLAVPDIACPHLDTRWAACNFARAAPYLATLAPVRNWAAFGLRPADHYFNSGVLVIDLAAWRRERLSERFLACFQEHSQHIWCWDQYALNVVLAGRWRRLPVRWNVGSHAWQYPSPDHAPWDPDEFAAALRHPAICHFTSEFKPWRPGSTDPRRGSFFAAVDETAWRGWRPGPPHRTVREFTDRWGVRFQRAATIAVRKLLSRSRIEPHSASAQSQVPAARMPAAEMAVPHTTSGWSAAEVGR